MSTPEESLNDQDPDYVSTISNNQVQQKVYEENARNTTARKITTIVEKEFSREINLKEKEILQIQERLQKALKTLHFLRYVIITDFYNHKQCQIPQAVETNKQTRIHPAVKSLLGKSPKFATIAEPAVPSTSTDSRFLSTNDTLASGIGTATDGASKDEDTNEQDAKLQIGKRKLLSEELPPRKIPRYVPPKNKAPSNTCPSRGERYKICKRIIVGNISKWIPPDWREDAASHKWTMYVRGDKNEANISAFVNKVRFFLHPSYRPNDVVEVTSYPFHLSRRGWGEFPLRVQLHFKNAMNKPIDIIHHLKLDRTYTGLQTLGSETLVDLWIHATDSRSRDQNISNECAESSINKVSDQTTGSNNDSNSELICEQPVKCTEMTEHLKPRFTASTSVGTRLKEEIASLEICKRSPSMDFTLNEEPADIKIKIEPDNTTVDSSTSFSTDLYKTSLEKIRFYINREHDYSSKQYSNSHCRTIKEGNVTIEHFPEKECSFIPVTDLSTIGGNKETSNATTITSHECNGDIQSSNDCRSLTVLNTSDTMRDNTQVISKHTVFQKHNNRKTLSSDLSKPLGNVESSSVSSRTSVKSAENTTTTINGFCKPFNASLDRLNNLQKATNSSNTCSSHLKPLEISIPPLFAPSTSKRVLLMKDKKLIPVEVRKRLADDDAKVPITSNIAKFDLSHSVSILKKPVTSNIKANVQSRSTLGNKKEAPVFTMRDTNSLLLNVDYDIPALKIADSRDLQYGYGDVTRNNVLPVGRRELPCMKLEDKDEKVMQRAKITLGKDRYRIQSKKEVYETVLRTIENANIADTEAFVRFVIRRLPIVTQDARDPEYRRLHPYTCCSEEDFFMCNVGKQRALEWYRAKMVRHVMQKKSIPDDKLWSIREIMEWARLHGYTPSRDTFGMPDVGAANDTKRLPDSSAFTAVLNTCTEPVAFQNWLQICQQDSSHRSTDIRAEAKDTEIDVESIDESPCIQMTDRRENGGNNENSKSLTLTPLELDESLVPLHNFVCENARDIGIKIGPEEVVPGVMYCAASRAIMRVIECFVEDLTRLSLAKAWERSSDNECPKVIVLDDVRNALASREEFDIFTNEGLGSRQQLDTTN